MARSLKKLPYIGVQLTRVTQQGIERKKAEKRKCDIFTTKRTLVINSETVGLTVGVHNGREFVPVYIIPQMVGYKYGEFVRTRVKPVHPKKTDRKVAVKGSKGAK